MKSLSVAMKHFREFLSRVKFGIMEAGVFADSVPTVLFTRENLTVLLRGDDAEEYIQCVDELYASVAKSEAFSEATVRDLAADAFAAIFQDNVQDSEALVTKADAALAHLRTLLEATPLDWDVYIPVEGLAPSGLPLRVGQVNFFLGAQTALAEIDRTVLVLLDKNDHLSVEERQRQAESVSQSITKHFSERPLGRVTVRAVDAVAARSKGEKDYSPYNRLH